MKRPSIRVEKIAARPAAARFSSPVKATRG
jgi:hypothetical protein